MEWLRIAERELKEAIEAAQMGENRHALNESLQAAAVLFAAWEQHGVCSRKLETPSMVRTWENQGSHKARAETVCTTIPPCRQIRRLHRMTKT